MTAPPKDPDFPALMWNAAGESRVFACAKDVPEGWYGKHPADSDYAAPEVRESAPVRRPIRIRKEIA